VLDLLASVYEQLKTISRGSAAYTKRGEAVGESLPECAKSFEELSKAVKAALETWKWGPLTIFLDSVDQTRGAIRRAAASFPLLDPAAPIPDEIIEEIAGLLSDLAAFLDPEVVILEGDEIHLATLVPALQRAIDVVAPGPRVVAGALGEHAALFGALGAASIVAYEGERFA
ncbi:MAG: hypothetical protein WCQ48_06425, partial [Chloroflexota bacterium]